MKRKSLLFCCSICFCSCTLLAQLEVGLQGGYSRAWVEYGNFQPPDDARVHIHTGSLLTTAYLQFDNKISLGVEPGFAVRGSACVPGWDIFFFTGDSRQVLTVIQFPVYIGRIFPIGDKGFALSAKLGAGPSYAIASYSYVMTNAGEKIQRTWDDMQTIQTPRWELGAYTGLQCRQKMSNGIWSFSIDAYSGFAYFKPIGENDSFRSWSLNLGYSIPIAFASKE